MTGIETVLRRDDSRDIPCLHVQDDAGETLAFIPLDRMTEDRAREIAARVEKFAAEDAGKEGA